MKIGYCFTGSFCTFARSMRSLSALVELGHEIVPIMSENAYYTDTRFQNAEEFSTRVQALCHRSINWIPIISRGPYSYLHCRREKRKNVLQQYRFGL